MNNPELELKKQLEQMIFNLLFVKSLHKQLKIIDDWINKKQFEALNIGQTFFNLVIRNFTNSIYIELNKMLNRKEDKNLFDWLQKVSQYSKNLAPKIINEDYERTALPIKEYKLKISEQIESLNNYHDTIENIIGLRNKIAAHIDKKYFYSSVKAYEDFPVKRESIDEIFLEITEILEFHCNVLLGHHSEIELHSSSNIDSVLRYVRAFDRVRKDKEAIKLGIYPYLYNVEDYPGSGVKPDKH